MMTMMVKLAAMAAVAAAVHAHAHTAPVAPVVVAWGALSTPEAQRINLGFVFRELDLVDLSLQAGAYEDSCSAGGKCHFNLLREMVQAAPESSVRDASEASSRQRVVALAELDEALKGARLGDVLVVEMAGTLDDEAYVHNDGVMAQACAKTKQVARGAYSCFLTGKTSGSSKVSTAAARRRRAQITLTRLVTMTPELFMGLLLCLLFTLTLILFFCCTDNIEAQTFFASKYAAKGKVFE